METIYDIMATTLFIATAGVFFFRFRSEDPPLAPYMLVSLVCAVGNWLGNNGGAAAATLLLIAGWFYVLHIAGEPYAEERD